MPRPFPPQEQHNLWQLRRPPATTPPCLFRSNSISCDKKAIEKGLLTPSLGAEHGRGMSNALHRRSATSGDLLPVVSSRGSGNKAQAEIAARQPAILGDRLNLQETKRASSGPPAATLGGTMGKLSSLSARINASGSGQGSRAVSDNARLGRSKPPVIIPQPRPLSLPASLEETPKADLMQHNFARLGAPSIDVNSSALWNINTSKTTLPEGRRAAAIARLERKRAERMKEQQLVERNKENHHPGML